MTERKLIQIFDHCDRLIRRQHDVDNGRAILDRDFEQAFDEACLAIWKVTYDEVDWDIVPEQPDYRYDEKETKWREYAATRGYSIESPIPNKLIPEAERFIDMIMGEEYNAFALTPEKKSELKLKQEAESFIQDKNNGVISGR